MRVAAFLCDAHDSLQGREGLFIKLAAHALKTRRSPQKSNQGGNEEKFGELDHKAEDRMTSVKPASTGHLA